MKSKAHIIVRARECRGNPERMIRKFIKKTKKERIIEEIKDRRYYKKPSVKKKEKRIRAARTRKREELKRQREKIIATREGGGYNFNKQADQDLLKDIDNAFVVDIIDPVEGKISVSLNPLADLIEETKDISVAVENSVELQGKLKTYVSEVKVKVDATRETVQAVQKSIERDLDKLANTLGDRTFEATPAGYNNFFY